MRIVEAGIDNFGCLHQRVFPFDDGGLTVFEESNGFGKSTLAVFIKVMFYGLSGKARNVNGNERKKYMPWQGGSFGGYLIYEKDGVRYRIVRKFGKTRKEDTFTLSEEDTGKRIALSADSLGEQLFGLDVSSFERSVVFPQGEAMAEFSTSQISQRLTGLIEASDRNSGYDIAIKQIDETRKSLKPFRGDGGELASVNRSITNLQNLIASKEQDRTLLNRVRAEGVKCDEGLAVTQGWIDRVRSDIEKLSIRQSENALCEQRDDLVSNVEELAAQLKESSSRMISPAPSLECIEAALETAKRYESLCSTTLNRSGAASSLEVTETLSYRFNQGVPSKDSLREVGREIDDLEIKKERASAFETL